MLLQKHHPDMHSLTQPFIFNMAKEFELVYSEDILGRTSNLEILVWQLILCLEELLQKNIMVREFSFFLLLCPTLVQCQAQKAFAQSEG